MSFQQGLSGLNGASKNLDVLGNNIANASTVGFKGSRAEFADVYANSLYGSGGVQVGIGTRIAKVAQQFTQGNLSLTNNPLDVAINGDGFFRLSDQGAITYSRNGQFHLDKDGYLVNNTGINVQGYTTLTVDRNNNVLSSANLGNIQIDLNDLQPQATGNIALAMNLDASVTPKTIPAAPAQFDPTDATGYNYSTAMTVYDSLGNAHSLMYYFVRDTALDVGGPPATQGWAMYAFMDKAVPPTDPTYSQYVVDLNPATTTPFVGVPPIADTSIYHVLQFDASGTLTAATSAPSGQVTYPFVTPPPGAIDDMVATFDFRDMTQFAGGSGVNSISQDGYARGRIVGVSIDNQGIISGRYTNGLSKPLQQLALANFRNPNALVSLGDNMWASVTETGPEILNPPGQGVAGVVQSGATEDANVDLTAELVNLIVAQRMYQANAQTIKAQDTILQTLVNLR